MTISGIPGTENRSVFSETENSVQQSGRTGPDGPCGRRLPRIGHEDAQGLTSRTISDFPHQGSCSATVTNCCSPRRRVCGRRWISCCIPKAGERIDRVAGLEAGGSVLGGRGGAPAGQRKFHCRSARRESAGGTIEQAYEPSNTGQAVVEVLTMRRRRRRRCCWPDGLRQPAEPPRRVKLSERPRGRCRGLRLRHSTAGTGAGGPA